MIELEISREEAMERFTKRGLFDPLIKIINRKRIEFIPFCKSSGNPCYQVLSKRESCDNYIQYKIK